MIIQISRNDRHCGHESSQVAASSHGVLPAASSTVESESKSMLVCILFMGLLFLLCFLGIVKGLIGLFCFPKVGMYGLNLLIDLPRPLSSYDEKSLEKRTVVYDIVGWPIHPDTLDRTVRLISKRTEFCLNVVFFLAYPLAAITYVCGICFCIKNYQKIDDDACFKHVDLIKITNQDRKKPSDEDRDTKYVLNAMKTSRESLQKHGYCSDECICVPDK